MWYRNSRNCFRLVTYLALPVVVLVVLAGQRWQSPVAANLQGETASENSLPDELVQRSTVQESPEFQAVTDRTTELGAEEMPAYWQLLASVERETFKSLQRKQVVNADFNSLLQTPATFRGQPMHVQLNVRRILAYEVDGSPLQTKRLYEVWGWLDEQPENLYVVVTADLPEGMIVGATVHERAEVCGYFFKLQGYLPAGAETRMAPLAAPLLVGKMIRSVPPKFAFAHEKDWWRVGLGTILIISLAGSFASRSFLVKAPRGVTKATDPVEAELFEEWLHQEDSQTTAG